MNSGPMGGREKRCLPGVTGTRARGILDNLPDESIGATILKGRLSGLRTAYVSSAADFLGVAIGVRARVPRRAGGGWYYFTIFRIVAVAAVPLTRFCER
jgi:hypothetical protein